MWVDRMPKQILSLVSCSEVAASELEESVVLNFAMLSGKTFEVTIEKDAKLANVIEHVRHQLCADDVQLLGKNGLVLLDQDLDSFSQNVYTL